MEENKSIEEKPLKDVPYQSGWGVFNLLKVLNKGPVPVFEDATTKLESKVVKMNFNGTHYLVTDHIAARDCYKDEKFNKMESFGYVVDSLDAQRNHCPMVHSSGERHNNFKENFMAYMEYVGNAMDEDKIIKEISEEFSKMKSWRNIPRKESKKIDIEGLILEIFVKIYSKIVFGKEISGEILENWLLRSVKLCYDFNIFRFWNDRKAADKLYTEIENTPYFQSLTEILQLENKTKEQLDEIIKDLTFALAFNGYGGARMLLLSNLICLFKLSQEEKEAIKAECNIFLKSNKRSFEGIEKLKLLHQYYMEVARLFPPAGAIWRQPKEDIIIESNLNRFVIPKNEILTVKIHMVQADPLIFQNPKEFSLKRDIKVLEDNVYTWGGLYHTEVKAENYKCPGAKLGIALHKIFIMHFLKCDMEVVSDLSFTGTSVTRLCASDKPLKMKTFQYKE